MTTKILQIESVEADELISRLNRIEAAILYNSKQQKHNSPAPVSDLLTRTEVAKILHVSLVTISDWVDKGVLKAYKLGNRVYFKASEVESSMTQKGGIYAVR